MRLCEGSRCSWVVDFFSGGVGVSMVEEKKRLDFSEKERTDGLLIKFSVSIELLCDL